MNADIRVYPDQEMKAIDMAEIVDSVQLNNGILQGCGVSIQSNSLHINDGRILIRGRLGVVTAGNIELPTLSAATTCSLTAVCDLAIENPFYISLLTAADIDDLELKKSLVADFNAGDGVDYVILGTARVDPATGIVSDWTPQNANPVSNKSVVNPLIALIGNVAMGTTATTVTGAIRELLTKINTNITNISNAVNRITSLERKTQGISGTRQYTAEANSAVYVNLEASSVYLIITSGWTTVLTSSGMYIVSATTGSVLGIKSVSSASNVVLSDTGNNGILKIQNNGNITLRVAVITLSGSVPL